MRSLQRETKTREWTCFFLKPSHEGMSLHFAMFRKPQALNSEEKNDMNVKGRQTITFSLCLLSFSTRLLLVGA